MISLDFGLFWCGTKISYLRYLTFKTLRHFHPNSKIDLYLSKNSNKTIHKWGVEQQDFEKEDNTKDYLDDIRKLGVNVIEMDYFSSPNHCPVYQADLMRFWFLYNFGGIYLDTDQLILKSFESLPLEKDFIYSQFSNFDRPKYAPTGVLGCAKGHEISKVMMKLVPKIYSPDVYNSSGPDVFQYALDNLDIFRQSSTFNAPYDHFYPINCSKDVTRIFSGEFRITNKMLALHLYGGHPLTQKFNARYNEDVAKSSNDTISRFLRDNDLL